MSANVADSALARRELARYFRVPGYGHTFGTGVGLKRVQGYEVEVIAIQVYVSRKSRFAAIPRKFRIPSTIDGIPVDVCESCPAVYQSSRPRPSIEERLAAQKMVAGRRRVRPLIAGVSCANLKESSGTLGYFCRLEDDRTGVLSCAHVLGSSNKHGSRPPIIQAAAADGGTSRDIIAHLHSGVDLLHNKSLFADVAIAVLSPAINYEARIMKLGAVQGTCEPSLGSVVVKHGRGSGFTVGVVRSLHYEGVVFASRLRHRRQMRYQEQIRIEPVVSTVPFTVAGDSGALVVTEQDHHAVGLHFAGAPNGSYSLATPIRTAQELLGVELLIKRK